MRPSTPDRGEEGASATLFVIALTSLLAVTMLAIDGGSLYLSRRAQVADTDAAALAAARQLADDPCGTSQSDLNDIADDYIAPNDPTGVTARIGDVDVTPLGGFPCTTSGTVEVTTERDASIFFAGIFGYERLPTRTSTTVLYGPGETFPGVRPIGLCGLDGHYDIEWEPYVRDLRNGVDPAVAYTSYEARVAAQSILEDPESVDGTSHPSYANADVVHRYTFERTTSGGSPCPGAAGNFGFLDFDSGGNQAFCSDWPTEISCGIAEGSDVEVSLGTSAPTDEDCNAGNTTITNCPPQTGALGESTADALNAVTCAAGTSAEACTPLLFIVYDNVTGTGNNAEFDVYSVVGVVLRAHNIGTGTLDNTNYLDLEFVDAVFEGTVGTSDPGGTSPPVFYLCGVNSFRDQCPAP